MDHSCLQCQLHFQHGFFQWAWGKQGGICRQERIRMPNHSFGKRPLEFVYAQHSIDVQEHCRNELQQQRLTAWQWPFSPEAFTHNQGCNAQAFTDEIKRVTLGMVQQVAQRIFIPVWKSIEKRGRPTGCYQSCLSTTSSRSDSKCRCSLAIAFRTFVALGDESTFSSVWRYFVGDASTSDGSCALDRKLRS